jgi:hypothetical protein
MKCAGMEKTINRRWEKLCYHPVIYTTRREGTGKLSAFNDCQSAQ